MQITVVGRSETRVAPERATLHLAAGVESGDKSDALHRASSLVAKLSAHIQSMEGAGVSPIASHAVMPVTTRTWRPYAETGAVLPPRHAASADVRVTFRDFHALAQFGQQVGGSAGVTMVRVDWALTETTRDRLSAQLLGGAVDDARTRALALAQAAGAADIAPVEIADPGLLGGVPAGPDAMYAMRGDLAVQASPASGMAGAGPGPVVDLAPEDIVLRAAVHARFTTD